MYAAFKYGNVFYDPDCGKYTVSIWDTRYKMGIKNYWLQKITYLWKKP